MSGESPVLNFLSLPHFQFIWQRAVSISIEVVNKNISVAQIVSQKWDWAMKKHIKEKKEVTLDILIKIFVHTVRIIKSFLNWNTNAVIMVNRHSSTYSLVYPGLLACLWVVLDKDGVCGRKVKGPDAGLSLAGWPVQETHVLHLKTIIYAKQYQYHTMTDAWVNLERSLSNR